MLARKNFSFYSSTLSKRIQIFRVKQIILVARNCITNSMLQIFDVFKTKSAIKNALPLKGTKKIFQTNIKKHIETHL